MASVHILVPAQRYVFAVSNGEAEAAAIDSSADGFQRYKSLQEGGRTTGMVAFPNTLLIRGERDYLVDPGLIMQGAPVIGALGELGVDPNDVKDVILTHLHFDHAEGLAGWPMRRTYVHALETEAPYAQLVSGVLEMANLEVLEGEEGEIEPGLRWIRTPGHSDGLISLLVDTDDGLVVVASDCVGPLPEYFDEMDLPEDFGPEREELLRQWERIRELDPAVVIPGHNPPVQLR
jgi:glyoxylase-like metal-dependent hydrolase (beta-lactamase superfamily II)